ncbi:MAG TPA: shikimate dehydrogenase [Marmoricola sp.]
MTRCAVLGSPIAHSLSPVLHRAAYDALGLDWTYDAIDVDSDSLAAFLKGLDASWRGLSLTMPLKRAVLPLLTSTDEAVRLTGAANTVVLTDGRREGANTDLPGAVAALRERGITSVSSVAVLGGGATAATVVLAAASLGCRTASLHVRDAARAQETVDVVSRGAPGLRLSVASLTAPISADLVVSTIPSAAQTPDLLDALRADAVFEVRYDPWPTPIVSAAASLGATVVGGLDLLVHQAIGQVRLMTGIADVPLSVMRAAGERELAARVSD